MPSAMPSTMPSSEPSSLPSHKPSSFSSMNPSFRFVPTLSPTFASVFVEADVEIFFPSIGSLMDDDVLDVFEATTGRFLQKSVLHPSLNIDILSVFVASQEVFGILSVDNSTDPNFRSLQEISPELRVVMKVEGKVYVDTLPDDFSFLSILVDSFVNDASTYNRDLFSASEFFANLADGLSDDMLSMPFRPSTTFMIVVGAAVAGVSVFGILIGFVIRRRCTRQRIPIIGKDIGLDLKGELSSRQYSSIFAPGLVLSPGRMLSPRISPMAAHHFTPNFTPRLRQVDEAGETTTFSESDSNSGSDTDQGSSWKNVESTVASSLLSPTLEDATTYFSEDQVIADDSPQNYHGNPQNYHGNPQNYRGSPQNYRGRPQNHRGSPQNQSYAAFHANMASHKRISHKQPEEYIPANTRRNVDDQYDNHNLPRKMSNKQQYDDEYDHLQRPLHKSKQFNNHASLALQNWTKDNLPQDDMIDDQLNDGPSIPDKQNTHQMLRSRGSNNSKTKRGQQRRGRIYDFYAPPGALGVVIDSTPEGPMIHSLKKTSPLLGMVNRGDLIIGLDGINTRNMTAGRLTRIMAKRSQQPQRKLSFLVGGAL